MTGLAGTSVVVTGFAVTGLAGTGVAETGLRGVVGTVLTVVAVGSESKATRIRLGKGSSSKKKGRKL